MTGPVGRGEPVPADPGVPSPPVPGPTDPPPDLSSMPPMRPVPASPTDPERGLRGVMSAILIFEAVTILLGITVIQNGGADAPAIQIGLLGGLASAHVSACALVSRRYAVGVIVALQVLLIACWAINGAIGVMGIVFLLVWVAVLYLRREFRRRVAAGSVPPARSDPRAATGPGSPQAPGPVSR